MWVFCIYSSINSKYPWSFSSFWTTLKSLFSFHICKNKKMTTIVKREKFVQIQNDSLVFSSFQVPLVLCLRPSRSVVLLLVHGCLNGLSLQLLGYHLSLQFRRNHCRHNPDLVLLGLLHGPHLLLRHCVPLQNRIFRGKDFWQSVK